jgi:hypothetical protein
MDTKRKDGIYLFVIGALVFVFLGSFLGIAMDWSMADFKQLYYAARCLHEHADPYNESAVLATYRRAGVDRIEGLTVANVMTIRNMYPPLQFLFTFPFWWMSFGSARLLWLTLDFRKSAAGIFPDLEYKFSIRSYCFWCINRVHVGE